MPKPNNIENWLRSRKSRKKDLTANHLWKGICAGDRFELSKAITLIESSQPQDRKEASLLLKKCLSSNNISWRIGITGVPGVGKSTFIESFGKVILENGLRLAVLAIDPSSSISGGSILGDKTRMEWLSNQEQVFIRPTPSNLNLGGVAKHTRESILICEAAGYDVILIETVGVGQSETIVHSMVDFFLLLMLAGAGDDLQGIKRGIMEMSDALVITKADGENKTKAKLARSQYAAALHLFPPKENDWIVPTLITSSTENFGIDQVWSIISQFFTKYTANGWIHKNRSLQELQLMDQYIGELWLEKMKNHPDFAKVHKALAEKITKSTMNGYLAAEELLKIMSSN
jgi:LAO/AO transport system kinase